VVSENDVFHMSLLFVNMPFNEEDHILIKSLYRLKGYIAQKSLKDFPVKSRKSENLQKLLR